MALTERILHTKHLRDVNLTHMCELDTPEMTHLRHGTDLIYAREISL